MPQCLVIGGAGFIGSHLTEALVHDNWQVRVLDDGSTGNWNNLDPVRDKIDIREGSILDVSALESAVEGCKVVFHLAALASVSLSLKDPLRSHEVCATGTLQVLEAARRKEVRRVVYAASSSAYGNAPGDIRVETDPLAPLSPYAAAKLAGEHYCQAYTDSFGLESVRLRFFNIFGPRQDASSPYSGVIALFASALTQGKTPRIDGDGLQSRDFNYVGDTVQAIKNAGTAPAAVGQVYNIGSGKSTTILELVETLNKLLGTRVSPNHGPPRPGDVRHSLADISRARRDLDYHPRVSFADGLRETLLHHGARVTAS